MEVAMSSGRYRLRTRLRGSLPSWLLWVSPKGRGDCGDHEWYRAEAGTWRCYHCETGVSAINPLSPAERLEANVSALRFATQLPPTVDVQETIARLVDELDRSIHPLAEELEADPGSVSRIQAELKA